MSAVSSNGTLGLGSSSLTWPKAFIHARCGAHAAASRKPAALPMGSAVCLLSTLERGSARCSMAVGVGLSAQVWRCVAAAVRR